MKYILNIMMIYDSEAGIIQVKDEEQRCVRLSKPASRLLHELIINNRQVVERDYLIFKVWEEYGSTGSSMSLNVAISEIRKAFRHLNSDPAVIETLRKVGFMLSANIEYHYSEPVDENNEKMIPETQIPDVVRRNNDSKMSLCRYSHWSLLLAGMCILVTSVIAGILIGENQWFSFNSTNSGLYPGDNNPNCVFLEQETQMSD